MERSMSRGLGKVGYGRGKSAPCARCEDRGTLAPPAEAAACNSSSSYGKCTA